MELGLHDLLSIPRRLFTNNKAKPHKQTTGERIRLMLEELGPTFIKLGQFASTRSDILPNDIIIELERLQDNVPPFPTKEARDIIEQELGSPIEELFAEFNETPLAQASIGQVYEASLRSGETVAIKVQRPHIKERVHTDLEILQDITELAEQRLQWASRYQVHGVIEEFSRALKAELNYMNEGLSAERIAKQFKDSPFIHVPEIYWDYSSKQVLTMEFVSGIKLNEEEKLQSAGVNQALLAERIVKSLFHQIFIEGFFHGDPHPGNIMVLPNEEVVYLDFGSVGRISSDMRKHLSSFVIALMRQSTDGLIKSISRMGVVPKEVDMKKLRADIDLLRDKYYDVPLSQVNLGESVEDLFTITFKHHIRLPADLALLGKTMFTIEGIVERLDPDLSIVKMAEPFGKQLLKQRYHPKTIAENVFDDLSEYSEVLRDLPATVQELKTVIKDGRIRIEINVPRLERSLKKLDQVGNRLAFSIVLLAFSIIMTGLIIGSAVTGQATVLWNIPVIEIGFVIATLMFLMMLYGIFKSGRF